MKQVHKFTLAIAPLLMSAASTVNAAEKAGAVTPGGPGGLFQVLLALCVVLGVMMAAAWALKRFGPTRLTSGAAVRIVGGVSLGGRERIVVVEAADQWIVVGVAPGRVNALATMPKQESPPVPPEAATTGKNFADWLKQTLENRNGN